VGSVKGSRAITGEEAIGKVAPKIPARGDADKLKGIAGHKKNSVPEVQRIGMYVVMADKPSKNNSG
jgi:hypothetical protein